MSNKRKLDQRSGRTPNRRQGRGRHRGPGTIASLAVIPGQAGAKILAAGALGSAAIMVMQPGVASVAGGTAAAARVSSATLTANVVAQAPNTGGGVPTNPVDLLGLLLGLSPLTPGTPGNPSGRLTLTFPFSTDGLGTPSAGADFSISPANTNNDSLFGLGPRNSVGGALSGSLNSSTFGQSPTATQQTFTTTTPTLDQLLATDPELSGLIRNLSQSQTPTFDPPQLPTLQEAFPNAATGANSLNSLTPGEETTVQQLINQASAAPQGQDGEASAVLTPQQQIDQAFSAFPAQNGQASSSGQELTPQHQIDQTFSALQAQNGQTSAGDSANLLTTSSDATDSGLRGLVQQVNLGDPANPLAPATVPSSEPNTSLPLQVLPNPGPGSFGMTQDANGNSVLQFFPADGSAPTTFQPGDAVTLPDGNSAIRIITDPGGNPGFKIDQLPEPPPSNLLAPGADNGAPTDGQTQVADADAASQGDTSAPATPVTRGLATTQDPSAPDQDQPSAQSQPPTTTSDPTDTGDPAPPATSPPPPAPVVVAFGSGSGGGSG